MNISDNFKDLSLNKYGLKDNSLKEILYIIDYQFMSNSELIEAIINWDTESSFKQKILNEALNNSNFRTIRECAERVEEKEGLSEILKESMADENSYKKVYVELQSEIDLFRAFGDYQTSKKLEKQKELLELLPSEPYIVYWRANETACDKCKTLHNSCQPMIFQDYIKNKYNYSHPNCTCGFSEYPPTEDELLPLVSEENLFTTIRDIFTGKISWKDIVHGALELLGYIPVYGAIADGINAIWYLAEGDYVSSAFSGLGAIPLIGYASNGLKYINLGAKVLDKASDVAKGISKMSKIVDKTSDLAKAVATASDIAKGLDKASDTVKVIKNITKTGKITDQVNNIMKISNKIDDIIKYADQAKDTLKAVDKLTDATKIADRVIDSVKSVDKITDATKIVDKVSDVAKVTDKVSDGAKAIDKISDSAKALDKSSDALEIAKNSDNINVRNSWRQSEIKAEELYLNYKKQKSFINGVEINYNAKGSSRPDLTNIELRDTIEVKNYNLSKTLSQRNLVYTITKQYQQRLKNVPQYTQKVLIDVSGQNISNDVKEAIIKELLEKTKNGIKVIFKELK